MYVEFNRKNSIRKGCLKMEIATDQQPIINKEKPSFFKIVNSPLQQFSLIRENPKILIPVLFSLIFLLISSVVITISLDISEITSQLPQDLDVNDSGMQVFMKVIIGLTSSIGLILGIVISWFFMSAVQLMFAKFKKSTVTYKKLMSMNIHIAFIGIIGTLLNAILVLTLDLKADASFTSLSGIINPSSDLIRAILTPIEIFSIWQLILTAIGLQYVANLPKGYSWFISIAITVCLSLLTVITSLLQ